MLDAKDWQILEILQEDARATYGEMAERAGLSQSAVHDRLRKLEARGLVQGYRAKVNAEALGLQVTAFVSITASQDRGELARELQEFPEIQEMHSVAGEDTALLKVRTSSPKALQRFLDRLRGLPQVEHTRTTVVLETAFERESVSRDLIEGSH